MRDFIPPAPGTGDHGDPTGRHGRPLPDAIAIRAVPVPAGDPPYDDAHSSAERDGRGRGGEHRPGPPPPWPPPVVAPPPQRPSGPYGGAWPSRFAQVLAETLAGSRPPAQLAPWTTERARRRISELGPVLASGRQPRVRRVFSASPAEGVVELTVVVDLGTRVRALAVRLEREGPAGWRCTAVEAA